MLLSKIEEEVAEQILLKCERCHCCQLTPVTSFLICFASIGLTGKSNLGLSSCETAVTGARIHMTVSARAPTAVPWCNG